MSVKVNSFSDISFPQHLDTEINQKVDSSANTKNNAFETSSAGTMHAFAGEMRKLQLLRQFESKDISKNKPLNENFATSTKPLGGDDDEALKETRRVIDNYRRQIKPTEIKGSQPAEGRKTSGHARSKHDVKPEVQAEIMNNPERIFSGKNSNGRYVDIYYKNGSVVITEQGDKESVITAYGLISNKNGVKTKPFKVENVEDNPNYVEIKLEKSGSTKVVYPNKERFEAKDFPPKTNGGSTTGETVEITPNPIDPSVITPTEPNVPVTNEPPLPPKAPVINEELPVRPSPLGKLSGNLNRGFVILQLVQLGLAAYNMSQLNAGAQKYGYYIDPFLDKYVIRDPEKAAKNLPEGFELKFFPDPKDYYSTGESIKFTVKNGKFANEEGYRLVYNKEKDMVEAVILL